MLPSTNGSGAWFTRDEDQLGSIEAGKLADVVVLSHDFLDPGRVPGEAIKGLHSALTVVAAASSTTVAS